MTLREACPPLKSDIPRDDFERFCAKDPPPDLQKMVRVRGGYHRITAADWVAFDKARRAWNWRRTDRLIRGAR